MGQRDVQLILLGLVILVATLAGPSIAHRLLVPALGLVVGARAWWPPAPASTAAPDREGEAQGTGSTKPKIRADVTHLRPQPC
jgi:uncharacterized membrane protein YdfJ with MMPL/SSD domain